MKNANEPSNELPGLELVKKYNILDIYPLDIFPLDTFPEDIFDNLVELATHICNVPIAAISFIDNNRQWFKSIKGLNVKQITQDGIFCTHSILNNKPLVITDTLNDERFNDSLLVTSDPNIRFYAGVPLMNDDNHHIGTLCVMDTSPRKLQAEQLNNLKTLADSVMSHLNLKLSNQNLKNNTKDLLLSSMMFSHSSEAMMVMNAVGRIIKINSAFSLMTGYQLKELSELDPSSLIKTHQGINPFESETLNEDGSWLGEIWIKHRNGNAYLAKLTIKTIFADNPTEHLRVAFFVDITDIRNAQHKLQENEILLHNTEDLLKMSSSIGHLGGWMFDVETQSVHWSDTSAAIHEVEPGTSPTLDEAIDFYPPPWRKKITCLFQNCLKKGVPYDEEMQIITAKGRLIWVRTIAHPIFDKNGHITHVHGLFQDIDKIKHLEILRIEQNKILKRIANDDELSQILNDTLQMLAYQYPQYAMSILKLNRSNQSLHHCASLNLPESFSKAIEGIKIGPNIGSCGAAAFNKKTTIVSDISNDIRWVDYKELATEHSLLACWSVPIFSSDQEVLGTFAIYAKKISMPPLQEIELLEAIANIIGMAIEQSQSREHLKLLEACVGRLNDVILISEADPSNEHGLKVLYVNKAFEKVTGYKSSEAIGGNPHFLQGPESQHAQRKRIKSSLTKWQPVKTELINYKKNGEQFWAELDIIPVSTRDHHFTHWVTIQRDITQRKLTENKIQDLAFFDQLTHLPNRQLFTNRLDLTLANSKRTREISALLFIDLDGFKGLNDLHGHDLGDLLLQEVSTRLVSAVRDTDTVARFSGDEFVIILQSLSQSQEEVIALCKLIAQRILLGFKEPFVLNQRQWSCTASIGITLINESSLSTDDILKHADIAMHDAKSGGKNGFIFFDPAMQGLINKVATMEADMKFALQNEEFYLCYQPQVNSNNQVIGAEALIRWEHPKSGNIPPNDFIKIAEGNGQILEIGQWVLNTVCAQLSSWSTDPQKSKLRIAINISPRQFRQPYFVNTIINTVNDHQVNPNCLELELTEGLLVHNVEDVIKKMTALKAFGISFSVDDFGTGYSSLSYLKNFPLDQLKIDRSFVSDIAKDTNDEAITRTIITLGKNLGLNVIAEGVETQEQRDFLEKNGCFLYQGYLYSKPLTRDLFEEFIHTRVITLNE